jgi:hypothetical protein
VLGPGLTCDTLVAPEHVQVVYLRFRSRCRVNLRTAATDRWREFQRGPIYLDPDEVVDDSSPLARTLSLFRRVVTGVAEMRETEMREAQWDPMTVQAHILG